ncbi:MAG: GerMN domain-containing protein [Lachnospiraceae bacterium]|nr:GerMN domain-containing protein [Lachnospiraceae bacterium]
MKNGKKAAIVAAIAVIFLAACGSRANETISSGEIVVPEMSSEDLLVSSLEYLLLDNEEENEQDLKEQQNVQEEKEEVSGELIDVQQDAEEPLGETVIIYYGKGGTLELIEETVILQEKTADELISELAKHNIVSLDTKVLSFEEGQEGDATVLYLDLSKAAGEYLRTMSKEAECIIIASLTNTFLENYQADEIYLTVEGKSLLVSNAVYVEPIGRCTPKALMELAGFLDTDETQRKLPLIQEKE